VGVITPSSSWITWNCHPGRQRPTVCRDDSAGGPAPAAAPPKVSAVREPIELSDRGKFIAIYPAESYSASYSIDFPHPAIGRETFAVELSNGSYLKQIAPARTFGSREDEQAMRNMGLIRGASRENCVVLTKDGIENPPLRFRTSCAAQGPGPNWRPGSDWKETAGKGCRRSRRPCMHTALVSRILKNPSLCEEVTLEGPRMRPVPEPRERRGDFRRRFRRGGTSGTLSARR